VTSEFCVWVYLAAGGRLGVPAGDKQVGKNHDARPTMTLKNDGKRFLGKSYVLWGGWVDGGEKIGKVLTGALQVSEPTSGVKRGKKVAESLSRAGP